MALTRRFLEALEIEAEKKEAIISAHVETVEALKKERDEYREAAAALPLVQKELDAMKEAAEKNDNGAIFKVQIEALEKERDSLKSEITQIKEEQAAKELQAAKEAAARAFFKSKNIDTEENLNIVMRGSREEVAALELDEKGNICDTKALDELVSGIYSKFVATTTITGANTATPPMNSGKGGRTREEILQIKDTTERQAAWAEHLMNKRNGG